MQSTNNSTSQPTEPPQWVDCHSQREMTLEYLKAVLENPAPETMLAVKQHRCLSKLMEIRQQNQSLPKEQQMWLDKPMESSDNLFHLAQTLRKLDLLAKNRLQNWAILPMRHFLQLTNQLPIHPLPSQ